MGRRRVIVCCEDLACLYYVARQLVDRTMQGHCITLPGILSALSPSGNQDRRAEVWARLADIAAACEGDAELFLIAHTDCAFDGGSSMGSVRRIALAACGLYLVREMPEFSPDRLKTYILHTGEGRLEPVSWVQEQ